MSDNDEEYEVEDERSDEERASDEYEDDVARAVQEAARLYSKEDEK